MDALCVSSVGGDAHQYIHLFGCVLKADPTGSDFNGIQQLLTEWLSQPVSSNTADL